MSELQEPVPGHHPQFLAETRNIIHQLSPAEATAVGVVDTVIGAAAVFAQDKYNVTPAAVEVLVKTVGVSFAAFGIASLTHAARSGWARLHTRHE